MTQTMKGLLKGLRYISQIFDAEEEKEEEIQIGVPTDVKHVSHIGWDGPSSASPSWMNEFPESSSGPRDRSVEANGNPAMIMSNKDIAETQKASDAPLDSPTRRNKGKQSKRNNTSSNGSVGSPSRDPSGISKPRRPKSSTLGSESPSQDPSGATKKSTRKKTKGSSGGGSTRPSRSKGTEQITDNFPFSDPGPDYGPKDDGIKSVFDKGNI